MMRGRQAPTAYGKNKKNKKNKKKLKKGNHNVPYPYYYF